VPLELRDRLIGTALPGCDRGQRRARQVLQRPGQLRRRRPLGGRRPGRPPRPAATVPGPRFSTVQVPSWWRPGCRRLALQRPWEGRDKQG